MDAFGLDQTLIRYYDAFARSFNSIAADDIRRVGRPAAGAAGRHAPSSVAGDPLPAALRALSIFAESYANRQ